MSEHLASDLLERYRSRTLTPAELLAAHGHLGQCAACSERLQPVERLDAAFADLRAQLDAADAEALHLRFEDLAQHVDGVVDPVAREVIESHLAVCPRCTAEADDLRAFKSEVGPRVLPFPRRMLRWAVPAAGAAAAALAWLLITRSPANEPAPSARLETGSPSAMSTSPPPSQTRVALEDGGRRITLDGDGRLEGLPSLSTDVGDAVRRALDHQRVDTPPLVARLVGARGPLLGPDDRTAFALSSPVGTVVEDDRPTFRWRALPGADSYSVGVFDADLTSVAESSPRRGTEWRVPKPLARDRTYTWQVTATKDGKEVLAPDAASPEARFHVLSGAEAEAVAESRRKYAGSHLVLGVVYARAGLLEEAEREFQALAGANPDSAVARNLLRGVRDRRR